jgi:cell division septation protein DedD
MAQFEKQDPMAERHDTELFYMLVRMISTNALLAMGKIAPEGQQPPPPDVEAAAAFVDMLVMLEAKTDGKRNATDDQIIKNSVNQLQMIFVELVEKSEAQVDEIARAVQEQAGKPAGAPTQPEASAPSAPPTPAPAAPPAAPASPAPKPADEEKVRFRKSYGES